MAFLSAGFREIEVQRQCLIPGSWSDQDPGIKHQVSKYKIKLDGEETTDKLDRNQFTVPGTGMRLADAYTLELQLLNDVEPPTMAPWPSLPSVYAGRLSFLVDTKADEDAERILSSSSDSDAQAEGKSGLRGASVAAASSGLLTAREIELLRALGLGDVEIIGPGIARQP